MLYYCHMNYQKLVNYLFEIRDEEYSKFTKKLLNSDLNCIGVRSPIIKRLVKELSIDNELELKDFKLKEYLEIDLIYFGVSLLRIKTIDEQLSFLRKNIKYADSWAVTDSIPHYLKKCTFEKYRDFFLKTYQSKHIYERRFSYIYGLKFYQNSGVLSLFELFSLHDEYMVMMGEAWLLATIAIKYENEVYEFLKNIDDDKLKRKTISKIAESYRISEETKEKFKSLR